MRVDWLPEVLRAAGLTVITYSGWRTRGSTDWGPIRGVIAHGTGGILDPLTDMRILWVTGSVTAPAPIAQCFVDRDGWWTVGASGRCNHVKYRDVRPDSPLGQVGNANLIGVEGANNNVGEPWPPRQVRAYIRGVAAILAHLGLPAGAVLGHSEHQTGKRDVTLDMDDFRANVARILNPPPARGIPAYLTGDADMPIVLIKHASHPDYFAVFPSGLVRPLSGPAELAAYTDTDGTVPVQITTSDAEYDRLKSYGAREWWSV